MPPKLRLIAYGAVADLIHGIRYALVPALDWAWRGQDKARQEMEWNNHGQT